MPISIAINEIAIIYYYHLKQLYLYSHILFTIDSLAPIDSPLGENNLITGAICPRTAREFLGYPFPTHSSLESLKRVESPAPAQGPHRRGPKATFPSPEPKKCEIGSFWSVFDEDFCSLKFLRNSRFASNPSQASPGLVRVSLLS